mgnify:FL=1
MKRINYYLGMLLMMVVAVGCNEEFDVPPIVVPQATHQPNMTIADFKAKYWQDTRNFIDTCKEEIYIHGYVSSSDAAGNIYKYLFIQDETGGIGISIDASSLSTTYRVGQEIVLSMKDRWIGKYNGQYLIGLPEYYEAQSVWEAGRLPLETFKAMVESNGLPKPDMVQPLNVKISDFQGKSDSQTQLTYSGQIVKIMNVKWAEADGVAPYSEADASTNRTLVDEQGNQLTVVNSNYATFRADMLPLGSGDVTGILTMTGSDQWKLYIRDTSDCEGFSTDTKGTINDPYTVAEAIEIQGKERTGWTMGYVVGAVAPEVTTVKSNSDIEWKAPTTLNNTLVIAPSKDCTDFSQCLIVGLPQGSKFREQANLKDNDIVYKSQIFVRGKLAPYMGTHGITENTGSTSEYKLTVIGGGVTELNEGFSGGAIPTDWTSVQVSGNKAWYVTSFNDNYYAAMTGYKGTPPFDSWLITPALDIKKAKEKLLSFKTQVNGYGSTTSHFEVYVLSSNDPVTATKTKLNPKIAVAPASGYSDWVESGNLDLSQFDGTYFVGFRFEAQSDANYATWCVDDIKFGAAGGGGGGEDPEPVIANRADLETMNGGAPKSTYGAYTSTQGWKAANCNVLQGGEADSNPVFTFIGKVEDTSAYAMAVTLNGKTSAVGTLTSPVIAGGIKSLSFNYAMPYSDTVVKFSVKVFKADGTLVKEDIVENASPVKYQVYSHEITGISVAKAEQFYIVFTNLCPTIADSNKDRACVWNIKWQSAD